jgi:adenosine deaminase
MQAGIPVTLNSDDPPMFNTTLTNEYLSCASAYSWNKETLKNIILTAIKSALIPDEFKNRLTNVLLK